MVVMALGFCMVLGSLGGALALATMAERQTAAAHVRGIETLYAAEAGVELAIDTLGRIPDWSLVLDGRDVSPLLQGDLGALLNGAAAGGVRVAVSVSDDAGDQDGMPLVDSNGTVTIVARADGVAGARRTIEVTVTRSVAGLRLIAWRERRT